MRFAKTNTGKKYGFTPSMAPLFCILLSEIQKHFDEERDGYLTIDIVKLLVPLRITHISERNKVLVRFKAMITALIKLADAWEDEEHMGSVSTGPGYVPIIYRVGDINTTRSVITLDVCELIIPLLTRGECDHITPLAVPSKLLNVTDDFSSFSFYLNYWMFIRLDEVGEGELLLSIDNTFTDAIQFMDLDIE